MDSYCVGLLLAVSITAIASVTAVSPVLLLSPLIKANKTELARNKSLVDPSVFLNITSYSGFLTVDEKYNSNTFFWYFPVANKTVEKTPWIVWLQGGPGASSLAGLFDEIGPFEYTLQGLKKREWAWNKDHSVLFIDNPVGAGFSFTDSEKGFATNMSMYSDHLYSALQQFLAIFPELRSAPLYLAGESYAGRYVPALAAKIGETTDVNRTINLQGLILGNPVMNREDLASPAAVFEQWGLLDTQGILAVKPLQDTYMAAVRNGSYSLAIEMRNKIVDKINDIVSQDQNYNVLVDTYSLHKFEDFLRTEAVREALHVGEMGFTFENVTAAKKLDPDFLVDVQQKMEALLEHYRVLIYCGQLDPTAPCVPNAEARRKKWHWSHRDDFLLAPRVPWSHNESIAGYVKSGGGLTEVLIRGAGHLVPIDKPAQTFQLISYFIRDLDMPMPANYQARPENTPKLPDDDKPGKPAENPSHTVIPLPPKANTIDVSQMNTATKTAMIVSVVINVALLIILALGLLAYFRLKRKTEDFFYSSVDNVSDDIFLT